jgi:hypothetical protein
MAVRLSIFLITPRNSEEIAIRGFRRGVNDFLKNLTSPADLAAIMSLSLPWFSSHSVPCFRGDYEPVRFSLPRFARS